MENNKFPAVTNMILFAKPFDLTQKKLESAAQAIGVQNFQVTSQEADNPGSFVVFYNGAHFILMYVDQPVPQDTFNGVLQFSFGLDNAAQIVEKQKAHIIISPLTEVSQMGQGIMSAVGVTELSALVSKIMKPVGHYWMHSDTLSSQKQFEDGLAGVNKAMEVQQSGKDSAGTFLPKMMWVGFRLLGGPEQGKIGARTIGLEAFTGYELEITPIGLPTKVLGERIYGTVEYLFNNGPVLQDGQTLGVSEHEHFRLKYLERDGNVPPRFLMVLEGSSDQ